MLKFTRSSSLFAAVVAAALAGGTVLAAGGDDMKGGDMTQCVTTQTDKLKSMAADPAQMSKMTDEMAKMMVMDHMAMKIATDPKCQEQLKSCMDDANVKKAHEQAMAMAKDPAQSAKLMEQIMADPMAMKSVMHTAMMMSMMKDHMPHMGQMGGQMMTGHDEVK